MNESQPGQDEKFKETDDSLRLVFVCAMWLTGFDAPSCSTAFPTTNSRRDPVALPMLWGRVSSNSKTTCINATTYSMASSSLILATKYTAKPRLFRVDDSIASWR